MAADSIVLSGAGIPPTGVVTFKNARKLKEAVEAIPAEKILLETDCPYMAPEPYRGKRNSSLYLPLAGRTHPAPFFPKLNHILVTGFQTHHIRFQNPTNQLLEYASRL